MADIWMRPELKGSDSLVTPAEFAPSCNLDAKGVAGRLKSYADKAPQPVRVVNNRTRYYVRGELEKFMEVISSLPLRTAKQVAQADIVYLEQAIREAEEGLKAHDNAVIVSEKNVERAIAARNSKIELRNKARKAQSKRIKDLEIAKARLSLSD